MPKRRMKQPTQSTSKQRQMGRNQSMSINPAISGGGTPTSGPKVSGSMKPKPVRKK